MRSVRPATTSIFLSNRHPVHLKNRNIVIEAKHNLFTSSHLNQLKYNQLNRHQPRFTKSKKNKETSFTMHINSFHHATTVHEENRQTDSKYVKLREKRY